MSELKCPHCKKTVMAWDYSKDYVDELRDKLTALTKENRELKQATAGF